MIYIKENIPKKISGLTSLFISFDYNPTIIQFIKSVEAYSYDKDTREWEIPLTSFAFIVDALTTIDDITMSLYQESELTFSPKRTLTYKLKSLPHQLEAVDYGLSKNKWLLLDEPGLGKTKVIINLAEELHAQRKLEHCLVICGLNSLKMNWLKEIDKHSYLSGRILGYKMSSRGNVSFGSVSDRARELKNGVEEFFIIVNIEAIRSDEIVKAFKTSKMKIDMIVFDECHVAKKKTTAQASNLLKLNATYKIAATGTLIVNSPKDLFVPMKWTDNDHSTLTMFKQQYCIFEGAHNTGRLLGYKNLDLLKEELGECSLRRTTEVLKNPDGTSKLPLLSIYDEYVAMDNDQEKLYNQIKQGVKESCDKINLTTSNILAQTTRLRQCTSCPSALTTENIISSKIERACDLVSQIVSNGNKVVIFSMFKETINTLYQELQEYNPLIATGDIKDDIISKRVDIFQQEDYNKVMLATIQKMGTGITLTKANYVIFIDLPFTNAVYTQAYSRCYRIGSTKPVFVYNLICPNTMDEVILKLISVKQSFSDYIVDDKLSNEGYEILKSYIANL